MRITSRRGHARRLSPTVPSVKCLFLFSNGFNDDEQRETQPDPMLFAASRGQLTPTHEPQRRRIHEVDVALNKLGESSLGSLLGVFAQKLKVFHDFFTHHRRHRRESDNDVLGARLCK